MCTINYFFHDVKKPYILTILEKKYGAEGYVFWYKLQELLCQQPSLSYDFTEPIKKELLLTEFPIAEEQIWKMFDFLCIFEAIDKELYYEKNIIWMESLIEKLSFFFKKKKVKIPKKPGSNFPSEKNGKSTQKTSPKPTNTNGLEDKKSPNSMEYSNVPSKNVSKKTSPKPTNTNGLGTYQDTENLPIYNIYIYNKYINKKINNILRPSSEDENEEKLNKFLNGEFKIVSIKNLDYNSLQASLDKNSIKLKKVNSKKNNIKSPNQASPDKEANLGLHSKPNNPPKVTLQHFIIFWKLYPRKAQKGKAYDAWKKLCKKKDAPIYRELMAALRAQIKTQQWQNKKYIPLPSTWINQYRWLDDPAEMNWEDYKKDNIPAYRTGVSGNYDDIEVEEIEIKVG